jgi:hypothetical protein
MKNCIECGFRLSNNPISGCALKKCPYDKHTSAPEYEAMLVREEAGLSKLRKEEARKVSLEY